MVLKTKSLTPAALHIVQNKGTEYPFTGCYTDLDRPGTYLCRQCGLALYQSNSKFHSGCGWPSFDAEIGGAICHQPDKDGIRIEIICSRCHAHLGHVFHGEHLTATNTRYCINSLSLDFIAELNIDDTEEAIFAGGCFWGIEFFLKKLPGVLKTEVGYTGGNKLNPTYAEVCHGNTHYIEAIRVLYDPEKITYEQLTRYFFEIHDPTQLNRQGSDIGEQYSSVIFYYDNNQKSVTQNLISILNNKGFNIVTKVLPISIFWPAEDYHQDYYLKTKKQPYCHRYIKRF